MNKSVATSKMNKKPFISLVTETGLTNATIASSSQKKWAMTKKEADSEARTVTTFESMRTYTTRNPKKDQTTKLESRLLLFCFQDKISFL